MHGIMTGMRKAQDRRQKIKAARDTKRQKDEEFEYKKKIYKLRIEEMKRKGGDDPMLKMLEEQMSDQFKAQEAQAKVEDNQIGNADRQERERGETLKRTGAKVAGSIMKQRRQELDWSYNTGSRSFSIKPAKPKTSKDILEEKKGQLNPLTQQVMKQIQDSDSIEEGIEELLRRKDEAKERGIDVDSILDFLGFKEPEGGVEEEKSLFQKWFGK